MISKKCLFCNNVFELYPYREKMALFCSVKCKGNWASENLVGKRASGWKGGEKYLSSKEYKDKQKKKREKFLDSLPYLIYKCPTCKKNRKIKTRSISGKRMKYNKDCKSCATKKAYKKWLENGTEEKRRKKISEYNRKHGKKPPSWEGKRFTKEQRLKMSKIHKKRFLEKGIVAITPLTKKIRFSVPYKLWRNDVFKRDNYTCTLCQKKGGFLNAHHSPVSFSSIIQKYKIETYEQALKCNSLWNVKNGKTLCIECHHDITCSLF